MRGEFRQKGSFVHLLHFVKIIVNFEICREVSPPKGRSAACFLVISKTLNSGKGNGLGCN